MLIKFGTLMQFTFLTVLTVKNFKFWKSTMAAAAVLKNRKIVISRPRFGQFLGNLAHWCTYHNLHWYWYCFRGRVRLGGKGRFWCAACKSVNRTCSTAISFHFILFYVFYIIWLLILKQNRAMKWIQIFTGVYSQPIKRLFAGFSSM